MDTVLGVIEAHASKVDGIKISLLDKGKEIAMRRRLPAGVRMYTGDDFNYAELIAGDGVGETPNRRQSDALLEPTVPLSRLIFRAPTQYYKTGVVFLAYLNGHQPHMVMLAGHQAMRPLPYFVDIFKLADAAGLLRDPDLAAARMKRFLGLYGVEA